MELFLPHVLHTWWCCLTVPVNSARLAPCASSYPASLTRQRPKSPWRHEEAYEHYVIGYGDRRAQDKGQQAGEGICPSKGVIIYVAQPLIHVARSRYHDSHSHVHERDLVHPLNQDFGL